MKSYKQIFGLIVFLSFFSSECFASECTVEGLPSSAIRKGDVRILSYDRPSAELTLVCKCSLYTPHWVQYKMKSVRFETSYDPVKCVRDGIDCSPISYISQSSKSSGFYLYQNVTFRIDEPTVLLCSSSSDKETVIVNVEGIPPAVTECANAPPSTTVATISTAASSSSSNSVISTSREVSLSSSAMQDLKILPTSLSSVKIRMTISSVLSSTEVATIKPAETSIVTITETVTSRIRNTETSTAIVAEPVTSSISQAETSSMVLQNKVPFSISSVWNSKSATPVVDEAGIASLNGLVKSAGTPTTLVLLSTIVILLVIVVFLFSMLVYMRKKHKKVIKSINSRTEAANCSLRDSDQRYYGLRPQTGIYCGQRCLSSSHSLTRTAYNHTYV